MIVGCYALHLYCDAIVLRLRRHDEPRVRETCPNMIEIGGAVQTQRQAIHQAKSDGWEIRFHKGSDTRTVRCPTCSRWERAHKREVRQGMIRTYAPNGLTDT